ncbi:MAG: fibronectin type III domain-containing protein, partial [Bacteroidia bacterium]|nr:fibronectin type III domain-containing protein [Bacteroidia bacterium]
MKKITLIVGCLAFIGLSAMASTAGSEGLQEQASYSSKLKPAQLTPTAVTAVKISPSKQLIKWEIAGDANAFIIKYAEERPDARTEQKLLNVENATAFTLSELNAETTYNVWVKAVTRDGEGAWSQKATFTTTSKCTSPMFVEATEITNNKAVISWHSNTSGSEFIVRYTDGGEFPILNHKKVKASAGINYFELNELSENTTYHFWVKSVCDKSKSDWSSKVAFKTSAQGTNAQYSDLKDLSSKINLHPNPASDKIEITLSETMPTFVNITDVTGRT